MGIFAQAIREAVIFLLPLIGIIAVAFGVCLVRGIKAERKERNIDDGPDYI